MGVERASSRLQSFFIESPAGRLEALLQTHDAGAIERSILVCHPHPLYGGTMHNKVVHRLASTLHAQGLAVLRFNFRGAGRSAGQHDGGVGEVEDARSALGELRLRFPMAAPWVAGFSFGAAIASRLATSEPAVEQLILVAPPVLTHEFSELMVSRLPKLVIQGDRDDTCPLEALQGRFPDWAERKRLIVVPGANHFFDKQLAGLAKALLEGLDDRLGGAPSSNA